MISPGERLALRSRLSELWAPAGVSQSAPWDSSFIFITCLIWEPRPYWMKSATNQSGATSIIKPDSFYICLSSNYNHLRDGNSTPYPTTRGSTSFSLLQRTEGGTWAMPAVAFVYMPSVWEEGKGCCSANYGSTTSGPPISCRSSITLQNMKI